MQMRFSAERKSCLAPFCPGGLQLISLVGSMNAAVARDLADLPNGAGTASQVARDSLRHAMSELPPHEDTMNELVVRAMLCLAAYGIHVNI